ncbi:hypothetical protein GCM10009545_08430 [Saccharopolyspora thermophila]
MDAETWAAAQSSPEFAALRRKLRTFVFPVSALFLAWYLVYVLLADYAHGFMSTKLVGNINVGLMLGLLQFVSTFAITTWYVRYANRNLDPVAEQIRGTVEGSSVDGPAETADAAEKNPADADAAEEKAADADAAEKDAAEHVTEKDEADAAKQNVVEGGTK